MNKYITRTQMECSGLSKVLGQYLVDNQFCNEDFLYPNEYMTVENMLTILEDDFSGLDKLSKNTFRLSLRTKNFEYIYFRSNNILNVLWEGVQYKFKKSQPDKSETNVICICHDCKHFDYDFYMEIDCNATKNDYDTIKGIGVVRCNKFEINPIKI